MSRPAATSVTLVSTAIILLSIEGKLTLYSHPRFTLFALIAAACVLVATILYAPQKSRSTPIDFVVVVVFLGLLLALPPKSLTSRTASTRTFDRSATHYRAPLSALENLALNTKNFSFRDWYVITQESTNVSKLAGKEISIDGFITTTDVRDIVIISRFVMTCCAVDARPIGIPVQSALFSQTLTENSWVHIDGALDTDSSENLIIKPSAVRRIDEPKDPYVYL